MYNTDSLRDIINELYINNEISEEVRDLLLENIDK